MSGVNDLKVLLDRLKIGIDPLPQSPQDRELPQAAAGQRAVQPGADRPERFSRPDRAQAQRTPPIGAQNQAWNENKESMLFGMLATLTAALVGVLAGLDYLALIGSVFFSFFSMVMLLALFRISSNLGGRGGETTGLAGRLDALSRKVEMLSSRAAQAGGSHASAGGSDRERELEHKVEELRVLVKSLTKAIGLE